MPGKKKHLQSFGSWLSISRNNTPSVEKEGKRMSQGELSRKCGNKNIGLTEAGGNSPRFELMVKAIKHTGNVPTKKDWDKWYDDLTEHELTVGRPDNSR